MRLRDRLSAFLAGTGRAFDIGGTFAPPMPRLRRRSPADDARNLAGDWKRVEQDLARAIRRVTGAS